MCDFDDFDDDDFCDDDDFDDDDFEDPLSIDDDDDWEDEHCDEDEPVSDDDFNTEDEKNHFTWKEAMFVGGVFGPAYEEWLERRTLIKSAKKRIKH